VFELQALSPHFVVPAGHDPEQALLTQTWPLAQAAQLVPQCCTLDATHWLLQETRPDAHVHEPFEQVVPAPQVLPHDPQF
jgi:hypothetical protein